MLTEDFLRAEFSGTSSASIHPRQRLLLGNVRHVGEIRVLRASLLRSFTFGDFQQINVRDVFAWMCDCHVFDHVVDIVRASIAIWTLVSVITPVIRLDMDEYLGLLLVEELAKGTLEKPRYFLAMVIHVFQFRVACSEGSRTIGTVEDQSAGRIYVYCNFNAGCRFHFHFQVDKEIALFLRFTGYILGNKRRLESREIFFDITEGIGVVFDHNAGIFFDFHVDEVDCVTFLANGAT